MNKSSNLDILRSLAVLFVVCGHSIEILLGVESHARVIIPLGQLGVFFFFVHTCLVLMKSIQRSYRERYLYTTMNFYIRRAFRIYPLSILVVTMIILAHIPSAQIMGVGIIRQSHPGILEAIANLLLLQNIFYGNHILGVLWSLPIEVQMYITLPFLYFYVAREKHDRIALLLWVVFWLLAVLHVRHIEFIPFFLCGLIAFTRIGPAGRFIPSNLWVIFLLLLALLFCLYPYWTCGYLLCLVLGMTIPHFKEVTCAVVVAAARKIATYSYQPVA